MKWSIKAPAKWKNSVYVLMEICHQRSKWLGPWFHLHLGISFQQMKYLKYTNIEIIYEIFLCQPKFSNNSKPCNKQKSCKHFLWVWSPELFWQDHLWKLRRKKTREIKIFLISCENLKKTREINTCLVDCHCDHEIGNSSQWK